MKYYFRFFVIFGISVIIITTLLVNQDKRSIYTPVPKSFYDFEQYFIKNNEIKPPQKLVENIPDMYLQKQIKLPSNINKTCAIFPKLFDLKFENDHWQTQNMLNGSFYLLSAYYDNRTNNKTARIFGMLDQVNFNGTVHCQFWYQNSSKPIIVVSEKARLIWITAWGGNSSTIFHPYLITCPFPKNDKFPVSVSIVQNYCDNATNNIRISYSSQNSKSKKDFAVCVKGLNFPYEDQTLRIVEWIELLFILGAEKITFYEFNIHPTTKLALQYYVSRGQVKLIPITLIGGASNNPFLQSKYLHEKVTHRRLQEVLVYNDCLYQNIAEFKYVSLLDTDEVILPKSGSWNDLIKKLYKPEYTSYIARNVYFLDSQSHDHGWFDDIPTYMHMLQHVYRAINYTKPGHYVKGFHDTSRVTLLHNHFPLACLSGCKHHQIDIEKAHLQHYRKDCVADIKDCGSLRNNSVLDTRIWNHKETLVNNAMNALNDLKHLQKKLEIIDINYDIT